MEVDKSIRVSIPCSFAKEKVELIENKISAVLKI
jgi:hypothetical protein